MAKAAWQIAIEKELEPYNQRWKDFLHHKLFESEDRLLLLLSFSDTIKSFLEEMSFVSAYWFGHETSTGKESGVAYFDFEQNEFSLYVTYNPNTKESRMNFESFEPITIEEEKLLTHLFLEFGIIELIEKGNFKRNSL